MSKSSGKYAQAWLKSGAIVKVINSQGIGFLYCQRHDRPCDIRCVNCATYIQYLNKLKTKENDNGKSKNHFN